MKSYDAQETGPKSSVPSELEWVDLRVPEGVPAPLLAPAFQDIFRLFSSGPAGTVDMRSMKTALRNVGIQLSPQEMCQALQQADLDGGCPNLCPLVLSLL